MEDVTQNVTLNKRILSQVIDNTLDFKINWWSLLDRYQSPSNRIFYLRFLPFCQMWFKPLSQLGQTLRCYPSVTPDRKIRLGTDPPS